MIFSVAQIHILRWTDRKREDRNKHTHLDGERRKKIQFHYLLHGGASWCCEYKAMKVLTENHFSTLCKILVLRNWWLTTLQIFTLQRSAFQWKMMMMCHYYSNEIIWPKIDTNERAWMRIVFCIHFLIITLLPLSFCFDAVELELGFSWSTFLLQAIIKISADDGETFNVHDWIFEWGLCDLSEQWMDLMVSTRKFCRKRDYWELFGKLTVFVFTVVHSHYINTIFVDILLLSKTVNVTKIPQTKEHNNDNGRWKTTKQRTLLSEKRERERDLWAVVILFYNYCLEFLMSFASFVGFHFHYEHLHLRSTQTSELSN